MKLSDLTPDGKFRVYLLAGPYAADDQGRAIWRERIAGLSSLISNSKVYVFFDKSGKAVDYQVISDTEESMGNVVFNPGVKTRVQRETLFMKLDPPDQKEPTTFRRVEGTDSDGNQIWSDILVRRKVSFFVMNGMGEKPSTLYNTHGKIKSAKAVISMPGTMRTDYTAAMSVYVACQTLDMSMNGKPFVVMQHFGYGQGLSDLEHHLAYMMTVSQTPGQIMTMIPNTGGDLIHQLVMNPGVDVQRIVNSPKIHFPDHMFEERIKRDAKPSKRKICVYLSASTCDPSQLRRAHEMGILIGNVLEADMQSGAANVGTMGMLSLGLLETGKRSEGHNTFNILTFEELPTMHSIGVQNDIYARQDGMFFGRQGLDIEGVEEINKFIASYLGEGKKVPIAELKKKYEELREHLTDITAPDGAISMTGGMGTIQETEFVIQIKDLARRVERNLERGEPIADWEKDFIEKGVKMKVEDFIAAYKDYPIVIVSAPLSEMVWTITRAEERKIILDQAEKFAEENGLGVKKFQEEVLKAISKYEHGRIHNERNTNLDSMIEAADCTTREMMGEMKASGNYSGKLGEFISRMVETEKTTFAGIEKKIKAATYNKDGSEKHFWDPYREILRGRGHEDLVEFVETPRQAVEIMQGFYAAKDAPGAVGAGVKAVVQSHIIRP